jgi:hypothetical protein
LNKSLYCSTVWCIIIFVSWKSLEILEILGGINGKSNKKAVLSILLTIFLNMV